MSDKTSHKKHWVSIVLFASLLAFALRGVEYALIGSFVPICFITVVIGALFLARMLGQQSMQVSLKIWGVITCLYGVLRLVMAGIIFNEPSISAHALDSFSPFHVVLTLLYLAGGIYLFKHAHRLHL